MGPIEDDQIETFSPAHLRGEEVSTDLREILGHIVKPEGLGIPDPRMLTEHVYNTSKAPGVILVRALLGGTKLNLVSHKGCVCRASPDRQKQWEFSYTKALTI